MIKWNICSSILECLNCKSVPGNFLKLSWRDNIGYGNLSTYKCAVIYFGGNTELRKTLINPNLSRFRKIPDTLLQNNNCFFVLYTFLSRKLNCEIFHKAFPLNFTKFFACRPAKNALRVEERFRTCTLSASYFQNIILG